jgi:CDP-diacylglycerol--serine O-phosphatidyltransferase
MGVIQEYKLKDYATLFGTFLGFTAIVVATKMRMFPLAAFFIVLGIGADLLDGFLARKMNQINELGKQLDSISDAIVFGVAPAIVTFTMYTGEMTGVQLPGHHWVLMIICSFLFMAGSMSRLAWFNISTSEGYSGVPTPVTAGIVCLAIITDQVSWLINKTPNGFNQFMHIFMPILLVFSAWLNVTDKIAFGKSIRKKSGSFKYIFYFVSLIIIAMFIITFIPIPNKISFYFGGILLLWPAVIIFLINGFRNGRVQKSE